MKIRFNLLPLQQKKNLRMQKMLRMIMEQEIYLGIVVGFFLASLFAMYILLSTEASITKEIEESYNDRLGYREISGIHDKFKSVHKKIARIEELHDKHYHWSRLFALMSENLVDGIVIEEVVTSDTQIRVRATADTREQVVSMKEQYRNIAFNGITCFENVSVPEADLATPKNITFNMSFSINISCLQ